MRPAVGKGASGKGEKRGKGEGEFTGGRHWGLEFPGHSTVSLLSLLALGPPGSGHPEEALFFPTSDTSSNLEKKERNAECSEKLRSSEGHDALCIGRAPLGPPCREHLAFD